MKTSRRGYSLVECLVVISLVAVTLGTVTLTLHGLRRNDMSLRDELGQEQSIDRVASFLRQDVHLANAAELVADPMSAKPTNALKLNLGSNRSAEYSLAGDEVHRFVRDGDQITQRDTFSIRSASAGSWQIDTAHERPLVTLWLPLSGKREDKSRLCRLCAVIGLERE